MDYKNKRRGRESGHSYFLERKEHVSIEGRGNVFIRNTQTQVRELYRRHVAIEPEEPSSSQGDARILETSRQVKTLNKKIEDEIDKLKNFRDCFLQEKETRNTKQPKKLQSQSEKYPGISHKETPNAINLEAKNDKYSWPNSDKSRPYFRTMRVTSSPNSGADQKQDPKKTIRDQSPSNRKSPRLPRKNTRMGGGCTYGYNECMPFPSSVYQCDYSQGPTSHCYPGYCQCYEYPAAMSVPYSPNPCYQYSMGAVFHQQVPSYCACPPATATRRTTDLNTEEYCRGMSPSPRAAERRSKLKSRTAPSDGKRNRNTSKNPTKKTPQNEKQVMKVSLKKPQPKKTRKVIIKEHAKTEKVTSDSDYSDLEKLRLHRQYMEMYKQEHEKTAKKDSSPISSELETHPTYTKLTAESPELSSSSKESKIKPEPLTIAEISQEVISPEPLQVKKLQESSSAGEATLEDSLPIKEQKPMNLQSSQPDRRRVQIQDTFKKCTFSVKRQAVQGSMSLCQSQEVAKECVQYAVCASGPDIGLNCSLSSQEKLSMSRQSCQQSCHQLCHQSCQTAAGEGSSESQCVFVTEKVESIEVIFESQSPTIERKYQSEPYIRSISTVFGRDDPLSSVPVQRAEKKLLSQEFSPKYEGHSISSKSMHRNKHFSSPKNSEVEELFSFPEHTQLSVMSDSPRNEVYEGEGRSKAAVSRQVSNTPTFSRRTSNQSEENSPVFSQQSNFPERQMYDSSTAFHSTFNRSEENSPNFSLQLDSPKSQVYNSPMSSNRTFNRSGEGSPNLNLQFDSPKSQVYSSPTPSNRTFNRSEESSPNLSLQLDSKRRQMYSFSTASNRTFNRSADNSPDLTLHNESPKNNDQLFYQNNNPERGNKKDLDSRTHLAPTKSTGREKRTRSVKFEDESGTSKQINKVKSCRRVIDWERSLSMEDDEDCTIPLDNLYEEFSRDDSSFLIDSCRTSSTAEFTCNESNYEEDYLSCTESRTEHIPPFKGCPCMRDYYLTLAALSRPINKYDC
ncbi:uncharacterized protein LOC117788544 [Drosophila innubila]|uniref:uncharacterized protein LOC117788544 n=1 Tax=Drosophila innubila TaxID=198719 RepID=UPI00148E135D|nr:uncharacterized protein LOC117788544 [Drosophila innubila]